MRFWILWFGTFLVAEAYGLRSPSFPTLSQTWRQLATDLPPLVSYALYAATGAVLVWLLTVHWVWKIYDRPGFDRTEGALVLVGVVWGVLAARRSRGKVDA